METFLPLSPADLDALRAILASSWLIRSSGVLAERPTTGKLFHLHVGDLAADLRFQMPFDLASWPDRLTLLRDGWRIDQICQVPPADLLRRVRQPRDPRTVRDQRPFIDRVRALPGTDRRVDRPDARRRWPGSCRRKIWRALRCCRSSRATGPAIMAARYLILDWPDARRFQPLLYVDTDTVFDSDVTPMLHAVAMSDRIAAPIELLSPLVAQRRVGRHAAAAGLLLAGLHGRVQYRHAGHPQSPRACRDAATDPPDHHEPRRAAWQDGAALRGPGDRELRVVSAGALRYRADIALRPVCR